MRRSGKAGWELLQGESSETDGHAGLLPMSRTRDPSGESNGPSGQTVRGLRTVGVVVLQEMSCTLAGLESGQYSD